MFSTVATMVTMGSSGDAAAPVAKSKSVQELQQFVKDQEDKQLSDTRVYVRSIPVEWDEWMVFKVFKKFGVVNDIILPRAKIGASYRYGFVEMYKPEGCQAALEEAEANNGQVEVPGLGRRLLVEPCRLMSATRPHSPYLGAEPNWRHAPLSTHNHNRPYRLAPRMPMQQTSTNAAPKQRTFPTFDHVKALASLSVLDNHPPATPGRIVYSRDILLACLHNASQLPAPDISVGDVRLA